MPRKLWARAPRIVSHDGGTSRRTARGVTEGALRSRERRNCAVTLSRSRTSAS